MKKQVLIFAYILFVLTFSGLAQAGVVLSSVDIDQSQLQMHIQGLVDSKCGVSVSSNKITHQDTDDGPAILLQVSPNLFGGLCSLGGRLQEFDLLLDLKQYGYGVSGPVSFLFDNTFSSHIDPLFKITMPTSAVAVDFSGDVVYGRVALSGSGDFVIEDSSSSHSPVPVVSSIDLKRYLGKRVIANGIQMLHHVGPVNGIEAVLDPLGTGFNTGTSSSMYLVCISTAID